MSRAWPNRVRMGQGKHCSVRFLGRSLKLLMQSSSKPVLTGKQALMAAFRPSAIVFQSRQSVSWRGLSSLRLAEAKRLCASFSKTAAYNSLPCRYSSANFEPLCARSPSASNKLLRRLITSSTCQRTRQSKGSNQRGQTPNQRGQTPILLP